jgi:hypothetical protein
LLASIGLLALSVTSASAGTVSGDFNGDGRADLAVDVEGQQVGGQPGAGAVHVIYGSRAGLSGDGDRVFSQNTPRIKQTAEAGDEFGNSLAAGDFNGDGFADLGIGTPFEDLGQGKDNAGVVQILYGSRRGLRVRGNQLLAEGHAGLKDSPASQDDFGYALAAADLGHGRAADLAIGAAFERVNGQMRAGAVHVVYGSGDGLTAKHNQRFTEDTAGLSQVAEPDDRFGFSLAAGDLGGGPHADLVIGAPQKRVGSATGAGSVTVLYGSRQGIRATTGQLITQDTPGVRGVSESGDGFGMSLAVADLGRDRHSDLAIGVPFEDGAGAVNVLYGSPSGVTADASQFFNQDSLAVGDGSKPSDRFGVALAAANFGRNRHADLAVGVPEDCVSAAPCVTAGAVDVLYASDHGLKGSAVQAISQATPGVQGTPQAADLFGWAVAAGRFRGTKVADLVAGIPNKDVHAPNDNAGAIAVLRGSSKGITTAGDQFLTEGSAGLAGSPDPNDHFGSELSGPKSTIVND